MKKRWMSIVLVLVLTIGNVAGCGNSEGSADVAGSSTADESKVGTGGTQAVNADAEDDEDMADIVMVFPIPGSIPADKDKVEVAINEITESEINTHVTLNIIEIGNYDQQVSLIMSSNEKADLLFSMGFTDMISQAQLLPLNDLLDAYGKDVKAILGDLIDATTVGKTTYALTMYRALNSSAYAIMRTDVLEELGLLEKATNMTSLDEYEEILAVVKEKTSYVPLIQSDTSGTTLPITGCYLGESAFTDFSCYDQLGDSTKLVAASMDGSGTVYNNFASDDYKKMITRVSDWYNKGYVYKDAATSTDGAEALIKSGVGFSYFCPSEIGVEATKSAECGTDMTCVKLIDLPITTGACTGFTWTIPVTATEPEAAMKFLNMMYSDSRIQNLLAWGIENEHYVVKDGVAYYPEGMDSTNCGWHTMDWTFGNQFLVLPWEGQSSDFRTIAENEMKAAPRSPYLGFVCDTSQIQTELSAISNAIAE